MTKKYNASMFDKIKDALKKPEKTSSGSFSNIMRFPAGHTYTLRLIPNVENMEDTFFHHYVNQWTSKKDGSFVSALSLRTFGERDPINESRWKLYKDWKDSEPAKDEKFENPIKEKEAWFVNAYVIDDPANPENNGKVKILNMGPQLKDIVEDAMNGNRADEFGYSIFDLSKDGCDFKVVAEQQGVFTTYIKSYFTTKSKLDLSDEEIDEIYNNVHDLKQVYSVKNYADLQSLLDEHFLCEESGGSAERKQVPKTTKPSPKTVVKKDEDLDDDIPMFHETDKKRKAGKTEKKVEEPTDSDPSVESLLAELDID